MRGGSLATRKEDDVINTYRVWLRYELFRGNQAVLRRKRGNLQKFLDGRDNATSQTIKTIESELIVS
jgi:hypothetical protein